MDLIGLLAMTGAAASILWIIAVVLVITGIVTLLLIVLGFLVGPGGVSIFK